MAELHGIDISNWQAGINLSATDAQFVMCKATESTNYADPRCDGFVNQAKKLGMPWGVYHFYQGNARAEADWFVKNIRGYVGTGILALDFETHTSDVAGAKAWLDRVHDQTGIKPLIYMSGSVLTSHDWSSVARAGYGLWVARWASSPGPIAPWTNLTMWQYTDSHRTGGFTVDADRFYGDAAAWRRYAGAADSGGDTDDHGGTTPTDKGLIMGDVKRYGIANKRTIKDQWYTLPLNDDGAYSIATGPCNVMATVQIQATIPVGSTLQVRFHTVDYKSGQPTKVVTTFPVAAEQVGTSGSTFLTVPFLDWLGAGESGYSRRLRVAVYASGPGVVLQKNWVRVTSEKR